MQSIIDGEEIVREFLEEHDEISDEVKDLVMMMVRMDPTQRPSCSEALEHEWFSKNDFNPQMVLENTKSRLVVRQAKKEADPEEFRQKENLNMSQLSKEILRFGIDSLEGKVTNLKSVMYTNRKPNFSIIQHKITNNGTSDCQQAKKKKKAAGVRFQDQAHEQDHLQVPNSKVSNVDSVSISESESGVASSHGVTFKANYSNDSDSDAEAEKEKKKYGREIKSMIKF